MKFNMGCGHNRLAGFHNVDSSPGCEPDEVWDLDVTPWPWPDGCAEEIVFSHSLEHMGGDPKVFLAIMTEIYRIAAHDCQVRIHAPHPRHDDFVNDPTHVRAITPAVLSLFDRANNDEWRRIGAANSPFAHYLGVDFVLVETRLVLAEPWSSQRAAGKIGDEELTTAARNLNNVVKEVALTLRVRKPDA